MERLCTKKDQDQDHTITISLNNPKTSELKENEFIFFHKIEKVIDLIKSRVLEIESEEGGSNDPLKRFQKLKMHDAILIDGKRGSGKTTYLDAISHTVEGNSEINVKILAPIDLACRKIAHLLYISFPIFGLCRMVGVW